MDIVGNLSIISHTKFLFAQVHNVDSKIDYGMIMLVIGTGTIGLRSISQLR
jgi:threonine dehydrogenase-like Zn-dependent dehydrogenase